MEHTKESIIEYLKSNYDEDTLLLEVDNAMSEFLGDDWKDEFEDEYEAYIETGRGEAELQVRGEIEKEILKKLDITTEKYYETIGQEIWDTIIEVYEFLERK